jgi:hypothetical protein
MPRKILISFFVLFLTSCFSVKIDKKVTALDYVELRQNFFLFGLIGDKEIDLVDQCPRGVSGISEKFTFGDGVLTLITLGIYSPRTVLVNCSS